MRFKAHPWQEKIIKAILQKDRINVWADMGCGKTAATLTALRILDIIGEESPFPALVVAPLRVVTDAWVADSKKFDHLKDLKVVPVIGSPAVRRRALMEKADIYCINYENIVWLHKTMEDNGLSFKTIVADESTKLKGLRVGIETSKTGKPFIKGQGTKRSRLLAYIAFKHDVKRWINLTGTPAPNGLMDLWGQNWFIDFGYRLGHNFSAFRNRFFYDISRDDSYRKYVPRDFAEEYIHRRMKSVSVSVRLEDYVDIDKPIEVDLRVSLPDKIKDIYRQAEKAMFVELEGEDNITIQSASQLTNKCRQIANGFVYLTDEKGNPLDDWKNLHDEKLNKLESITEEHNGRPILVSYEYRADLVKLRKKFPHGEVINSSPKGWAEQKKRWDNGEIPMLFAHPASAGHGINLQYGSHILVYYSMSWNLEEQQQILERIGPARQFQAGFKRPVYVYRIITSGTIDVPMLDRLKTKAEVQDVLVKAMKNKDIDL